MSRILLSPPEVTIDDRQRVLDALDSGCVAPAGPDLARLEEEMAGAVGARHAVAVSSGTAALHLALVEAAVGAGDDVLVSTFTYVASVAPISWLRARPVFIDSDRRTWNLDPDLLDEELAARARRHRRPKAVVCVDLYGQCADYERIRAICERYGVTLIEDAAESLGATCHGRPAGGHGRFGVLSLNGNKIITASSGGMLVTDDERAAAHARRLAAHARQPAAPDEHTEVGYSYHLSNLLAALGRSQLTDLGRRVQRRREINRRYRRAFADLAVELMPEAPYGRATFWLSCLTLDRDCGVSPGELRDALDRHGIESRPTWKPMHLQPAFVAAEGRLNGTAQDLYERGLCLPSGSALTHDDQGRVIGVVRRLLGRPRMPAKVLARA